MITIDFHRLDLAPGARVLDVGCGSGRHLGEACRFPETFAVGIDANPQDLVQAEERLRLHQRLGCHGGGPWGLLAGDIRALPFEDRFFDLVICSEVLEHVPDHGTALAELVRVLKPGGDLAVSVPRQWPERICWFLAKDYARSDGGHIRIYKERELVDLVRSAGTVFVDRHFAHSLHTPYWWLKCLAGPNRDNHYLVQKYHDFLVWDLMAGPRTTRLLDRLLNPLIGKSLVLYFKKTV